MENSRNSRPSRSLLRRLAAPLGLAVAVLGGGTWGVYHFTLGPTDEKPLATNAKPHSAATAKEELKNLFAAETKSSPSTEKIRPPQTAPADRYAVSAGTSAASSETDRYTLSPAKSLNPLAPAPTPPSETKVPTPEQHAAVAQEAPTRAADRYANYTAAPPTLPPRQPNPSPAVADDAKQEVLESENVTRGQEPSVNPLRHPVPLHNSRSSSRSAGNSQDARAAFGSESSTPRQDTDPTASALSSARPLQQNSSASPTNKRTASTPGRYQLGTPQTANIPPAAGFEARNSTAGVSRPPAPQQYNAGNNPLAGTGGPTNMTPTPGLTNNPGTGRPGERLLEGVQSPSISIQKLSPEEIQVGKRCTFAIRVQNTGQRTAQNVEIHDEIPLGTELVGTSPRASVSGSNVIWKLGTLSVGEERTVEMELIPTEEGELGSVATVLIAAQASAKSRCTRPELALRLSASKSQVLMGEQLIVQIEVANPGSGDATGVMLLENVPTGVSHEAGPALEFEIGTLRAGESRRLELVLSAEKAGKIHNVMTARADASLQVEASCDFEVIAPELQLTVEGPQKRYLERPATYHVSIDNPGTATAHDIQLITHLPKGMQFVSANNMGEYDSASHTVQWSLMELPANERGTVELVALPIEPGAQTLQVATKARQGLEDRTEKQVLVEGLAALMFEVADLADPIEIGGDTTYEIRVVNQGSKAASNVQVVAILPPGLRALSGQGETRHTIQGERVSFAPIPSLAPKADTTYRIQVQGTRPGDQRLRVQITTDEIQQPITKEESTRVYADE
ncbi:MAG: hypothetical protein MI725_06625 [Pirellulales bacterium]|nr:hypothetical protein [Pirellulales bacterium]